VLYFFRCAQILDDARYIAEHGEAPPILTSERAASVRAIAAGNASAEQLRQLDGLPLNDHPPAWLRFERARQLIEQQVRDGSFSPGAINFANIARDLITNVGILWNEIEPKLPSVIRGVRGQQQRTRTK